MRIDTNVKLLIYRRTKIVATLGPSSGDAATIRQLIQAGVNVFRLNMSHGTHEGHRDVYHRVRRAATELEMPVAVLADLCGPKIRVGAFAGGGVQLEEGAAVTVTTRAVTGTPALIPSQYPALNSDVSPGNRILLDDGNIELRVDSVEGKDIACTVVAGGRLSDHKGMNLPGASVSAPSLTEADQVDAAFALSLGVDFIALSFVRRAADIEALKALIDAAGAHTAVVAKIEKPEALENIDGILDTADAIMVARGDLGVELPPQTVPAAQDQLIEQARRYRKPVIVATQMLESMITHPRPTRAEVSDVATAVRAGADAIMLSAETASGKYPVESVKMMDGIARQTEGHLWRLGVFGSLARKPEGERPYPVEDALSEAMAKLSRDLLARSIIVISEQDRSLSVMSASRPAAPIIGFCPDYRRTGISCLLWGVIPVAVDPHELRDPHALARSIVIQRGIAATGDTILVVKGFSAVAAENTPSVTIVTV
ncbi:MAG: pyruvate kinase [Pseudomonadota bacterium]